MGSTTAEQISVCMPGESGDIINSVAPDIEATMDSLTDTVDDMTEFLAGTMQDDVQTAWTELKDFIDNYYYSVKLDFSSSSDKTVLNNMANPNTYSSCASGSFATDSWVPSIQSGAAISCTSTTGNSADGSTCPDAASSASCEGCLDTFTILLLDTANIVSDLEARYSNVRAGGINCGDFADDMNTLWTNYYNIK